MEIDLEKYKIIVEAFNKILTTYKLDEVVNILEDADIEIRKYSKCNKLMVEVYVIDGGGRYYGDDDCLESEMAREEFEELYKDGFTSLWA